MVLYFSSLCEKEDRCIEKKEVFAMARVCYVTGRRTTSGNNRSHAMNKTKRTYKPNLQKVKILVDGKPKRVYVSAKALKSGKVKRA